MKNAIVFTLVVLLMGISSFVGWYFGAYKKRFTISPKIQETIHLRPLDKYTIDNLSDADIKPGAFTIQGLQSQSDKVSTYSFNFNFNPNLDGKQLKSSTGQINIPSGNDKHPIIILIRGYVDQKLYNTGDGTKNAANYFANNGFITVAPDFLGYADSDSESGNIFEARFQTYVLVLSLLNSLNQIESWDNQNVFIWGHSNGGHIALAVLEISKKHYPTTLWAPVSKAFPYAILYYTDESDDRGKLIRRELAAFEDTYNTDLYSPAEYFDRINAPIQIHQGTADDAVPISWSDNLYQTLLNFPFYEDNETLTYFKYQGADHNMRPNWDTAISRDIYFFEKYKK